MIDRRKFLAATAVSSATSKAEEKLAVSGGAPVRATPLKADYLGHPVLRRERTAAVHGCSFDPPPLPMVRPWRRASSESSRFRKGICRPHADPIRIGRDVWDGRTAVRRWLPCRSGPGMKSFCRPGPGIRASTPLCWPERSRSSPRSTSPSISIRPISKARSPRRRKPSW